MTATGNQISGITTEMAARLEAVTGSTTDAWLGIQAAYGLAKVCNSANNPTRELKRYLPTVPKVAPAVEISKQGYMETAWTKIAKGSLS